jgi:hypothetical protein
MAADATVFTWTIVSPSGRVSRGIVALASNSIEKNGAGLHPMTNCAPNTVSGAMPSPNMLPAPMNRWKSMGVSFGGSGFRGSQAGHGVGAAGGGHGDGACDMGKSRSISLALRTAAR